MSPHSKSISLPRYLLFCLIFAAILTVLIAIGTRRFSPCDSDDVSLISDKSVVVVIDAGHGGEDGGAIGAENILEKDLNLLIAKNLEQLLRANGIATLMTRTEDILLYDPTSDHQGQKKVQDLATRRRIAQSCENAVFVSIHMNAFPDPRYHGLQVYYSENHPSSRVLAEKVQSLSTSLLLPDNHRKIKSGKDTLYLLDRLECPAILVECGFLSNPEECARLATDSYQRELAMTVCLSLLDYFATDSQDGS